ncbi:MAG: hypothetical protein ACYTGW_05495 [Planctomycetota bacterium]|jgi:hypothetical protein
MTKVQIWVELSDDVFVAYEREAQRREVPVETLVEQTVNVLLEELERDEKEGTDHTIAPT